MGILSRGKYIPVVEYIDETLWAKTWREAGPRLEAIRRDEIRRSDHVRDIAAFGDVFALALRVNPPKSTSGLVEQQRCFALMRRDRTHSAGR